MNPDDDPISAAGKLRTALTKSERSYIASVKSAAERHRERCAALLSDAQPEAVTVLRATDGGRALLALAGNDQEADTGDQAAAQE